MTTSSLLILACAAACHEANRAWCEYHADNSQVGWDDAPEWQRSSAIEGVKFRLKNLDARISANHDSWLEQKVRDGWVYGEVKDAVAKTHPCMVPYIELPSHQAFKDALFVSIVRALAPLINGASVL